MNITTVQVNGRSMESLLLHGDIVVVHQGSKIQVGDVIVYKYNNQYIIHRVMCVGIWHILEMGDNNHSIHVVPKKQILGKAITNISRDISIDIKRINKQIVKLNWIKFLLGFIIKTPRDIIRNKRVGTFYLNVLDKRNELQKLY